MHTTNSLSYIVGMGELLWDMLPDGKKVGGAPANFANHIANLGLNGLIVSAVGNDSLGNEILDSLKNSKAKRCTNNIPDRYRQRSPRRKRHPQL